MIGLLNIWLWLKRWTDPGFMRLEKKKRALSLPFSISRLNSSTTWKTLHITMESSKESLIKSNNEFFVVLQESKKLVPSSLRVFYADGLGLVAWVECLMDHQNKWKYVRSFIVKIFWVSPAPNKNIFSRSYLWRTWLTMAKLLILACFAVLLTVSKAAPMGILEEEGVFCIIKVCLQIGEVSMILLTARVWKLSTSHTVSRFFSSVKTIVLSVLPLSYTYIAYSRGMGNAQQSSY